MSQSTLATLAARKSSNKVGTTLPSGPKSDRRTDGAKRKHRRRRTDVSEPLRATHVRRIIREEVAAARRTEAAADIAAPDQSDEQELGKNAASSNYVSVLTAAGTHLAHALMADAKLLAGRGGRQSRFDSTPVFAAAHTVFRSPEVADLIYFAQRIATKAALNRIRASTRKEAPVAQATE